MRLSPTRLNEFLGCEHRTFLDVQVAQGRVDASEQRPPDSTLIAEKGEQHEAEFLQTLRADGLEVVFANDVDVTERAMRDGVDVIHQAKFVDGDWTGIADFLIRIEAPSDLGDFSYEVHDAKLGRTARPTYVFQLLFYTDQVQRIQGERPKRMHLILGDGERPPFAPEEFDAYAREVTKHFLARRGELEAGAEPDYPYPVGECAICPWWKRCADQRRADDHLSLVAGLQRRQGLKFEAAGVRTLPGVAEISRVPGVSGDTLDGLRQQARLQVASRGLDVAVHEFLEPEPGKGFARLPAPSPGDVYFDFEGDPFYGRDGLEYLFGTGFFEDGSWRYWPLWATDEAGERANFEAWMAWITDRLATHPDLHIFHYNHYEPTTLKALMQRYGTCEEQLDELLRRLVMVDLFAVVKQAMRIGTEAYGLKALEPVFGFVRSGEVDGASGSLRAWHAYVESGDQAVRDGIQVYNENDCKATAALLAWLYVQRSACEAQFDLVIDALEAKPAKELSPELQAWIDRVAAIRAGLVGIPDTELLREIADYHRREAKPAWWEHYARVDASVAQLRDEDSESIGDLTPAPSLSRVPCGGRSRSERIPLKFPKQEYKLAEGKAIDPATGKGVNVDQLDEEERLLWITRVVGSAEPLPEALIPEKPRPQDDQQEAVACVAERIVAARGFGLDVAADLLLRRPPRSVGDGGSLTERVLGLQNSVLFVQGPPGAGKTYTGGELAVALMRAGQRVGVAAISHKAVINLLGEIDAAAARAGFVFSGLKKANKGDDDTAHTSTCITSTTDRNAFAAADPSVGLLAATAHQWAWDGMRDSVDVLLVDEAGQVSLADALAISLATSSMVLLGDPQQLAHVSQGTHAGGSGASVLQHLLGDADTVTPEFGEFLDETWRMHPEVCSFVSSTMYDGRLEPRDGLGLERQSIWSPAGLSGSGLRLLEVSHEDCKQRSQPEAVAIRAQFDALLAGGKFTDRDGVERDLTLDDILVVAPFNAQVRRLKRMLPRDARVGTVDKFQGQQAPVVFFSMTSSSGEDIPRGMDFLFSRNRLNVAVSRAQALAVVVCSPKLLWAPCATVDQMKLVNMLCKFADASSRVPA